MLARVLEIERCALAGWPAAEVEELDGWRLRAMVGITRRANSVWTSETTGSRSLDERIRYAEAFYAARGLPAVFQVAPGAQPSGLEHALEARGYRIEAPVSVETARAVDVALGAPHVAVTVTALPTDAWFGISGARGRFATVQPQYRALLARLGGHARFALASCDGNPAAVGLGALGPRWMGISSMFTLPEYRRRGAARSILRGLASAAAQGGAESLFLQVERDNTGALDLYRRAGFVPHHVYNYRVGRLPHERREP